MAYVQAASAFGFAMQTYRLLVLCKQESGWETKKSDMLLLIFYPVTLTTVLAAFCIKDRAIQPQAMQCDVTDPPWIRLIGYAGSNLVISTVGMYISGRSAYALFAHLKQFRSTLDSRGRSQLSETTERVIQRRYAVTKGAAIRMVSVSALFILINFFASIQTIITVINGQSYRDHDLKLSHFVGPLIGIALFLVFGTGREMRRSFRQALQSIRNRLTNYETSPNPNISRFD
ncbi:3480_t:CDS:2 [Ambispora leptoticha]|uniref:3480_t:CDS:1 n=1 Tax=Ambispora leptoticha TaxID=144679 RepID=A0A9N9AGS5_9GLOM|nr:3480_t:CDS:2 [Ambispora leptoticha]